MASQLALQELRREITEALSDIQRSLELMLVTLVTLQNKEKEQKMEIETKKINTFEVEEKQEEGILNILVQKNILKAVHYNLGIDMLWQWRQGENLGVKLDGCFEIRGKGKKVALIFYMRYRKEQAVYCEFAIVYCDFGIT